MTGLLYASAVSTGCRDEQAAVGQDRRTVFSGCGVFDTDLTSLHFSPSSDTWIVYDFGYAVSQTTATRSNVRAEPRSTCIHWWSS